jgi:hypothetical protein
VDEEQSKKRLDVGKILRNGSMQAAEEDVLRTYYTSFALARWTVEENLNSLPKYRKELQTQFNTVKRGPVHDWLLDLVLQFMRRMLQESRPPALRVNAVLTIADLNTVDSTSASQPTVPSTEALSALLDVLNDQSEVDAVKIGALIGLARHARLVQDPQVPRTGMGDPQVRQQQVIPAMVALAQTKADPKRSPEGHAWMRALAIDVLANLRAAGAQGEIANTLGGVVAEDPGAPIPRVAAAKALGYLDYSGVAGLDPMPLAIALTGMAAKACRAELEKYEEAKTEKVQRGPMGMGMGMGMEGMEDMEESYEGMFGPGMQQQKKGEGLISRRRFKSELAAAMLGLRGPDRESGVGGMQAAKEFAKNAVAAINKLIAAVDDEDADDETLAEMIEEGRTALEELVQQPQGAAT